jgi:SnoaL-like domain
MKTCQCSLSELMCILNKCFEVFMRLRSLVLAAIFFISFQQVNPAFSQTEPGISEDGDALRALISNPPKAAGRTDFNVVDRFAIYNLLSAYSMTYDAYDVHAHASLFWPEAIISIKLPGQDETSMPVTQWFQTLPERFESFEDEGFQRRHIFGKILFLEEGEGAIHTVHNALLANVKNKKETSIVMSVIYEGWYEKRDDVWKIIKWRPVADASLDVRIDFSR